MAEVLLFHHAQGLTPGVLSFADQLRQAGNVVHVPDLYDGRTFGTLDSGIAHATEIGFDEIIKRGVRVADRIPPGAVYAGFSLGVMPAQKLAQTRPGARAALFFHSCVPLSYFGREWPASVAVQIHAMQSDPLFIGDGDLQAARDLVQAARSGELFLYPGDQHLFADSSLPSFDPDAATLLTRRVVEFLTVSDSSTSVV